MSEPLVSVHMITYNHAPYISQAIEGVLMQKTNFPFELVIGEDCSTDGTQEIVFDYARTYPDIIRVITSNNNVGMHENSTRTQQACRGKYIAYCEGDDFWNLPEKLQIQINLLEANSEYSGCFHNVQFLFEDGEDHEEKLQCPSNQKEIITPLDILKKNIIPTCSIVLRKKYLPHFPSWATNLKMGDWPNNFLIALNGDWAYLPTQMGVYRIHSNGAWSKMTFAEQKISNLKFYEAIYSNFNGSYKKVALHNAALMHYELSDIFYNDNNILLARSHLQEGKKLLVKNSMYSWFLFKLILRYYSPNIFKKSRSIWRRIKTYCLKMKETSKT
jgi:glycosyltransferase involved in cell wall biosynthesis